ncbi:MAG TPA: tRNA (guanosine(37)-N1)-methyltransferase TrmD [Oligoflexia bacterium]|nr:tRNA (guanosine(37)-N1)-methyltransferase TrmD [Oligoflexia bacterium]HMR25432.1 tRNA (guanosine(37)-N1)-methyltransferase TrmD [Oligoflexia bacterium]
MQFDVVTLVPEYIESIRQNTLWRRAEEKALLKLNCHQLRDYGLGPQKLVDDTLYGGGPGMLLRVDVLVKALESIKKQSKSRVLLASPQGPVLNQAKAEQLSQDYEQLILISGRYEGVDERFIEGWVDEMFSIGDYILPSGDLPCMVMMESVSRCIKGVVGDHRNVAEDSFSDQLLKYPQYTRPEVFLGRKVPDILLSGHHEKIDQWRKDMAKKNTLKRRPDMVEKSTTKE